jgi:hypothetical protein
MHNSQQKVQELIQTTSQPASSGSGSGGGGSNDPSSSHDGSVLALEDDGGVIAVEPADLESWAKVSSASAAGEEVGK